MDFTFTPEQDEAADAGRPDPQGPRHQRADEGGRDRTATASTASSGASSSEAGLLVAGDPRGVRRRRTRPHRALPGAGRGRPHRRAGPAGRARSRPRCCSPSSAPTSRRTPGCRAPRPASSCSPRRSPRSAPTSRPGRPSRPRPTGDGWVLTGSQGDRAAPAPRAQLLLTHRHDARRRRRLPGRARRARGVASVAQKTSDGDTVARLDLTDAPATLLGAPDGSAALRLAPAADGGRRRRAARRHRGSAWR